MNNDRTPQHEPRNGNLTMSTLDEFIHDTMGNGSSPAAAAGGDQADQAHASSPVDHGTRRDEPAGGEPQGQAGGAGGVQESDGNRESGTEEQPYVSSLPPEATYRIAKLKLPTPEIDRGFIEVVASSGTDDGAERVRDHHIALFDATHAMKLEVLRQQEATRAANVAGRRRECDDLSKELNRRTDRFFNKSAADGSAPWSWMERIEFALFALLPVMSIGVAIFNPANILRHSGEEGFATWSQAVPFCVTLLLGAAAIKAVGKLIPMRFQRLFAGAVLAAGIACFLAWILPFSELVGWFLTPAEERIAAAASDGSTPNSPTSHFGWTAILLATFAEALICAGAWITCSIISQSHRLQSSAETPAWKTKRAALDKATRRKADEENLLGIVRGELKRELGERDVLVRKACALYAAKADYHRNMRDLLG